jgi:hypothetical protein
VEKSREEKSREEKSREKKSHEEKSREEKSPVEKSPVEIPIQNPGTESPSIPEYPVQNPIRKPVIPWPCDEPMWKIQGSQAQGEEL